MCDRDGGGNCAKILVITFNIICIFLGAGCLAVGIWAYVDSKSLAGALGNIPADNDQSATEAIDAPSLLERGQWALITGGGVTIIVSIIGCIGACKESKPLLIFFAVIVLLCLLIEIAAGVVVIFFRDKLDEVLKEHLFDTMAEYKIGMRLDENREQVLIKTEDEIEDGWDTTQVTLECCGIDGYKDWQRYGTAFEAKYKGKFCGETIDNMNPLVPLSCCKTTNPHRYPDAFQELYFVNITGCLSNPTEENANLGGCYEAILDKMELYSLILIIVCLVVGILQVAVVIAAIYLACRTKGKTVED